MLTALYGHPNTVIFRRALLFVYGLTDSSQKPERQKYTDTIREFERRMPNHYRATAEKMLPEPQDRPMTAEPCFRESNKTVRKTDGRHREESLPPRAGPSSLRIRRETQAPE